MYYNDYVISIREYLRRYHEFTVYIANIQEEIKECESQIQMDAAPKVPTLSPSGGCGGNGEEHSPQEQAYFRKEELNARIIKLHTDLNHIEPLMKRLNRSLDALTASDRQIIQARFIDGQSWENTARCANCSVGFCRKRANKILEMLAGMMFGPGAVPVQTSLVFLTGNCG